MKIKAKRLDMLAAVERMAGAFGTRSTLPVLTHVLVESDGGKVRLRATDLDVTLATEFGAEGDKCEICLPGARWLSVLKMLTADDVALTVDEKKRTATLVGGAAKVTLIGLGADEFPPMDRDESTNIVTFTADARELHAALHGVMYVASNDASRYVINSVLLKLAKSELLAAATDGRRLALVEGVVADGKGGGEWVVPTRLVTELARLLADAEGEASITATPTRLGLTIGPNSVAGKLIDVTFPNFRQVIPGEFDESFTLSREALAASIRLVSVVASARTDGVKWQLTHNELRLSVNSPDVGTCEDVLPIKYDGPDKEWAMNAAYSLEALAGLGTEEVTIRVIDDVSPVGFFGPPGATTIVMPLRLG